MNKLLFAGGIATLVLGFVLLVLPVGHIPLLDANRQVLVESERGGYCAGETYATTRGMGSAEKLADCMETNTSIDNTSIYTKVQPAFCRAIIARGINIDQPGCEEIMRDQEFWPTATGALTNAWNKRFPYPGNVLTANQPNTGGESRTGDREGNDREGFER